MQLVTVDRDGGIALRVRVVYLPSTPERHYAELALWRGAVREQVLHLRLGELGAVAEALCDAADEIGLRYEADAWTGV